MIRLSCTLPLRRSRPRSCRLVLFGAVCIGLTGPAGQPLAAQSSSARITEERLGLWRRKIEVEWSSQARNLPRQSDAW